jgi:acyl carrier protein
MTNGMTLSDTSVQRRMLPLLGTFVEPRSPTERAVAEIWRQAFNMDCVGIKDSYEDLGGDSLLAASIFVDLEKSFGIKIPWSLLEDARTIEQLAVAIDDLRQRVNSR